MLKFSVRDKLLAMIPSLHTKTWAAIESHLTPPAPNSKNWRLFHYLPAPLLLPFGLGTLIGDTAWRILGSIGAFFTRDPRDPKKDFTAICDDSRNWEKLDSVDVSFDSKFLFGVATCTFQDSGAVNCPDSQWANWEEKNVAANNRSGKSADLFQLYQTKQGRAQIIERLKKLGVNSYRFSLEWSHIEPRQGEFNEVHLQAYVELCKALRKNGIAPMVTLHHFSEPQWFHDLGSFEKEENIDHFVTFCKKVYPALAQNYWLKPLVEHICTINEPGVEAFSRYVRGAFSPGYYFRFNRAGKFLKGMLKAHCIAYDTLKELNPKVQIGIVHQRLKMKTSNPLIQPTCRYINRLVNETTLDFFKTKVFRYQIPFSSHIVEEGLNPKTDFVGMQYYTRPVIGLAGSTSYHEPMTKMPFREDPAGIYEAILETYDAFHCPILITENGISTDDPAQRRRYFSRALYAAGEAAKKIGLSNLRGYYAWSFCDNSEWDMGRHPQAFGAYFLDDEGKLAPEPKEGMEPFIKTARASKNKKLKIA